MEITTFTMILVIRMISLSFCYKDGGEKVSDLLPEQVNKRIVEIPSVLEFLSYTYFCCTCLCGPFYDYMDYKRFIEEDGIYKKIPSTIIPSIKQFLKSKICLVLTMAIGTYYWPDFCSSDEYQEFSFLYKVFYYYVAMTGKRFLYYVPWSLTDAAITACGLSYEGEDEKGKSKGFDGIYTVGLFGVELGISPASMMISWNHMVHIWLKQYVYMRQVEKGKKPTFLNNMSVFAVSAFWHGFYPFYYIMLIFCAILSELSKEIFRARYFFRAIPWPLSTILANVASMLMMNFWGICFSLLTLEKGYKFSKGCYFFPYWVILGLYIFMRAFNVAGIAAKLQKKDEERKKQKDK